MCPKGVSPRTNLLADLCIAAQPRPRPKPGYLAIAAIFRNEARWMREWIEYHRLVGVDHFFLYNNHSQDRFRDVLRPYRKARLVTLLDLPMPNPFKRWQVKAYFDALQRSRDCFTWLAAMDLDEFLCPIHALDVPSVLRPLERHAAVFCHWKMFGTGQHRSLGEDGLQTEQLTRCAAPDLSDQSLGKTIAQPTRIQRFKVHEAVVDDGSPHVLPSGKRFTGTPDFSTLQINHYFTRAQDYFETHKKPRRLIAEAHHGGPGRTAAQWDAFDRLMSLREDFTIQRFVPELKRKLCSTSKSL